MGRILFSRWLQQVSDEGDVLYVFPKDYRAKLAAKSFRIKFEPWLDKAKVRKIKALRVALLRLRDLLMFLHFVMWM